MGPNSGFQWFLLLSFLLLFAFEVQAQTDVFNVENFGACGDGKTDNTTPFQKTWQRACQSTRPSMVVVPRGKFLVGPIVFMGPCKGPINFFLHGDLLAPTDAASRHVDHWISFQYIAQLKINGGGSLDGKGPSAWKYKTCSKPLPISLRLDFVTNSAIDHLTFIDSKGFHLNIFQSNNILVSNVNIVAPCDSPNTDGIHIADSNNIQVLDSVIGTGDDCVSMGPGSKDVNITNVQCGPGHGISIGSLGAGPNEQDVIGVHVTNCNLTGTMYGVRIKTFPLPYPSTVSQVTFDHINVNNVGNPIIIDQQYVEYKACQLDGGASGVKISHVGYSNIQGVSTTQIAVNLICSPSNPCQKIEMRDIDIGYHGPEGPASSSCLNAYGVSYGRQQPPSCLKRGQFSSVYPPKESV